MNKYASNFFWESSKDGLGTIKLALKKDTMKRIAMLTDIERKFKDAIEEKEQELSSSFCCCLYSITNEEKVEFDLNLKQMEKLFERLSSEYTSLQNEKLGLPTSTGVGLDPHGISGLQVAILGCMEMMERELQKSLPEINFDKWMSFGEKALGRVKKKRQRTNVESTPTPKGPAGMSGQSLFDYYRHKGGY